MPPCCCHLEGPPSMALPFHIRIVELGSAVAGLLRQAAVLRGCEDVLGAA